MIMNVSSMEGTLPLPYKAVYTATKAFTYAFSLALHEELKGTSVSVSVLCPGAVPTTEDGIKRMKSMGRRAKLLVSTAEFVSRKAVEGMLKGKRIIIPGTMENVVVKVLELCVL